jgi:uncharacterized protein YndB with AHSA1/START domain
MSEHVSVSEEINAPAEHVWAMVADLPRMGEWSPENDGAKWLNGATAAKLGAKFAGSNSNGAKKWTTVGTIVEAEPGRVLAFQIKAKGFKVAEWRYLFEATPTGCRVTETWTDQRGRIAKSVGKPVSGVSDRVSHNRTTMEKTLESLKVAAESASKSS